MALGLDLSMNVVGSHLAQQLADNALHELKMVFNQRGAILFPGARQHRDQKAEGISYEDNYKGNALAAMVYPGRIEVRFHEGFKDSRVRSIVTRLLAEESLRPLASYAVTYQGRKIR